MPPKSVYFYVVDAGALATMSAMADNCPDDIDIIWVAEGYARKMLIGSNIKPINTDELLNHSKYNYDLDRVLLLGPQHSFSNTVEVLHKCEEIGFKTVFVTDHWSNYHLHFTKDDGTMIFPTCIFAIDDYVRSELMALGIGENKIVVIGHLGIEKKIRTILNMNNRRIKNIRNSLKLIPGYKVILLVLESDFDLMSDVASALYSIDIKNVHLVVKPHPVNDYEELVEYIESKGLTEKIILCPEVINDVKALAIADMLIGVNSALLMLPLILGIPLICVQYNQGDVNIPYLQEFIVKNNTELSTTISDKLSSSFINRLFFPKDSAGKAWHALKSVAFKKGNLWRIGQQC